MHLFTNDHKPEHFKVVGPHILFHLKIFQQELKTVLCMLHSEL